MVERYTGSVRFVDSLKLFFHKTCLVMTVTLTSNPQKSYARRWTLGGYYHYLPIGFGLLSPRHHRDCESVVPN